MRQNGLTGSAEEISRQQNIQAAEWLLFTLFTQIYSERGQKVEQDDIKSTSGKGKSLNLIKLVDRNVPLDRKRA